MKVRHGFVSNSSSTSFSIFGAFINYDELKTMLKFSKGKESSTDETDYSERWEEREAVQELLEATIKKQKAKLAYYQDEEGGTYVGRDYESIKDNETGKALKEAAKKDMKKVFGKVISCETITTHISN